MDNDLSATMRDYMDGEYNNPNVRWSVIDADGFWLMDTNNRQTADQKAFEVNGTIKVYDGKDQYRGTAPTAGGKEE